MKYLVMFTYTVAVEADDYEQAEDKAHDDFAKQMESGLHPSDFAVSDAEEWEWD